MEPLGGIILAAGLSSRMGRYKPLIEVQGRSMIGHVIDRMRGAGASPIVVVTGHRAQELRAQLAGEPVEFITPTMPIRSSSSPCAWGFAP